MTSSDAEDDLRRSNSPESSDDEQESGDMTELQDGKDVENQSGTKIASNAKDPSRPRRKKARRACYACQRAHLTCGDERPCQRCIKRGLQDACQDGVRKKAKYLHDAPNEALLPGVGSTLYNQSNALRNNIALQAPEGPHRQQSQFYPAIPGINSYAQTASMPPPMMPDAGIVATSFGQTSPVSPAFDMSNQQAMRNPSITPQQTDPSTGLPSNWNGALFDPSDPALFNFDLDSMNFVNHYGALEFGMLGHMATGAVATPPSDSATQRSSIGHMNGSNQYSTSSSGFTESPNAHRAFPYGDTSMPDWANNQNMYAPQFNQLPHAFAIETNNAPFTSPDAASSPPGLVKFEESPTLSSSAFRSSNITSTPAPNAPPPAPSNHPGQMRQPSHISTPQLKAKSQLPVKASKRPRDPSAIYKNVTSPYPYTTGFHSLIAYLQRRFSSSPSKTLAIAKSLASIRPSFIATTKTLNRDDLIFMEKCFQRTLWEYEGFIEGVGTPSIIARRTGEIAAVGKEFSILTGWKKDVLLGREPNLNVNRGGSAGSTSGGSGSGTNTAGRMTGMNTPRGLPLSSIPEGEGGEKRLQPVFLAELLDDDSVVQFYEDFARLAFGDSRGSIMGKGRLLKYRTKEEQLAQELELKKEAGAIGDGAANAGVSVGGGPHGEVKPPIPPVPMETWGAHIDNATGSTTTAEGMNRKNSTGGGAHAKRATELKKDGIAGERGMQKLGFRDGKVECTFCWTVKRDVFDIPMLIVMNFLPCI